MIKYSGDKAKCLKCGCTYIRTKYKYLHAPGSDTKGMNVPIKVRDTQNIKRTCPACEYSWNEMPLDHNEWVQRKPAYVEVRV